MGLRVEGPPTGRGRKETASTDSPGRPDPVTSTTVWIMLAQRIVFHRSLLLFQKVLQG